jgi:hypothetical protein
VPEHLEVLRVAVAARVGVIERVHEADPCIGDWLTPRIWAGGWTPSRSSTVGTMSMMCAYCVRTSPLGPEPLGPGDDERIARAATIGLALPAAERSAHVHPTGNG